MRRFRTAALLAATLAAVPALRAQGFGQPSGFVVENPVLRRMWSLGMDSSMLRRYGQVLFDSIGPRMVGTPQMDAAQAWMLQAYQALGISARQERYGTWRGWRRGRSHIDLIQPRFRTLEGTILGYSPGTNGRPVRAPVIILPDVADSNALVQWLPQARGKLVLVSFPQPSCRPDTAIASHATAANYARFRAQRDTANRAWTDRIRRTGYPGGLSNGNIARRLDQAGVAGVLTNTWSAGWGVDRIFSAVTERAPVFDVSCEDYGLLFRLAENNMGPVVEITAESQSLGEVPASNVIAEIRGSELPDEYVVLSAHFDSWDGASGATDNGTGTITMLEAMRILKAAYPNPRRTILVGHWNAEEMGLIGSRAFAADNPRVIEGLQVLFNQDNGTGRIQNVSASGLVNASANLARWLSNLPADITRNITNFGFPGGPAGGGSDNASFICSGAPGLGLGSEGYDYGNYTWHTNRDTYDKLDWDDLRNNATMIAMLAYLASEDPQRVPRERRTILQGQGGQPGTWPACVQPPRATPRPVER